LGGKSGWLFCYDGYRNRKGGEIMAKKSGGGASPYVGNGNTPVKAPHIKGGGTESVKIITPKGK
jgi:hypothetical protein